MRHLFPALLLLFLAGTATAQQGPPAEGKRPFFDVVNVEVMNVEVFVTDKAGQPVTGLTEQEFELFLDGESVPVSYFYAASGGRTAAFVVPADEGRPGRPRPVPPEDPATVPPDQRLHIAIVVDNEHIRSTNRKRVFRDLATFLDTRVGDDAVVSVASLNPELVVHSDFLSDRAAVHAMLDEIERTSDRPRTEEMERRQILGELSSTGRVYNRGASAGFDIPVLLNQIRAYAETEFNDTQQTLKGLAHVVSTLAGVPGRKALLHVSDGVPNRPGEDLYLAWVYRYGDEGNPAPQGLRSGGMTTDYFREIGRFDLLPQFQQLGDLANAARVTWYTLDAEADHVAVLKSAGMRGGVASEVLDAFEGNLREPLELVAKRTGGRRLQESATFGDQLAQLGTDFATFYSLGFNVPPGLSAEKAHEIRVRVSGKALVVRHRQTWKPKSSDERSAEATTAALLYNAVTNPLGIELTPGAPQRRDDGAYVLPVEVKIPLKNLLLVPNGHVHAVQLYLFVATRDKRGQAGRVQKLPFGTAIPSDKLEEALGQSARYTLPVVVKPGDQQVAIGVRDELGAQASYLRLDLTKMDLGGP